MADVNSVWLEGKVFGEVKQFADGQIVSFQLGTSDSYQKKDGTIVYENAYHNCTVMGKLVSEAHKIFEGMRVRVSGSIKQDKVEKDGERKTYHKIKVRTLEIMGVEVHEDSAPAEDFSGAEAPSEKPKPRKRPAYKTKFPSVPTERTPEQQEAYNAAVAKMEAKRDDISIEDVPF